MSITFAVTVSSILLYLFIIGYIWEYELDGLAPLVFIIGVAWAIFGLGIAGSFDESPSYPTSQTTVPIMQTFTAPDHTIHVFCKDKPEMIFTKLQDAYLVNAKEVVYTTGRKNLWGSDLSDIFNDLATKKLNNQ